MLIAIEEGENMQRRRKYTGELKEPGVAMLENSGKSGHEFEQDRGIGSGMIYRWRAQLRSESIWRFLTEAILGMRNLRSLVVNLGGA